MGRGTLGIAFVGLLGLGLSTLAHAATVNPLNHATNDFVSGSHYVYFPANGGASCSTAQTHLYPTNLSVINATTDDTGPGLRFTVAPTKTLDEINHGNGTPGTGDTLVIRAEYNGQFLALYDVDNVGNSGNQLQVNYGQTDGATKTVGIRLQSAGNDGLCGAIGGTVANCGMSGRAGQPIARQIKIGIIDAAQPNFAADTDADYVTLNVVLVDCPTHPSGAGLTEFSVANPLSFSLIPGDQRMKVVNASTAPIEPTSIMKSVVAFGNRGNSSVTYANARGEGGFLREFTDYGGGVYTIDGLENEQEYCVGLGWVNKGGFVTTDSSASGAFGQPAGSRNCATPSQIDGFLNRSTCFVASAAYGDEWDSRLEVLRQFRDQILIQNGLGREFVEWYYNWSPQAAHWLLKNPGYRAIVRVALIPMVEGAKFSLWMRNHMWVFGVLLLLGTGMVVTLNRRTMT